MDSANQQIQTVNNQKKRGIVKVVCDSKHWMIHIYAFIVTPLHYPYQMSQCLQTSQPDGLVSSTYCSSCCKISMISNHLTV